MEPGARPVALMLLAALLAGGCKADPELRPDELLQTELGLTERDAVHTITLTGGEREVATPAEVTVAPDAYVEFVTGDWLVHEVLFEVDSLSAEARDFLERTDQVASPPLLRLDSRFVIDFEGGPPGRYPFLLQGSSATGRGVVIVEARP